MYLKKNLLPKLIEKALDYELYDSQDNTIKLKTLLNTTQIHQLLIKILNDIPQNDLERVISFHDTFKVQRELTNDVNEYKYAELRFRLIQEEAIELSAALGFSKDETYIIMLELLGKVYNTNPVPEEVGVLDALLDLLYVTYGSIDIFNMSEIAEEGMKEVQASNMSKVLNDNVLEDVIKNNIKHLKEKGFNPKTIDLKNGYIQFKDIDTGKILKPLGYKKPNLERIINYNKK